MINKLEKQKEITNMYALSNWAESTKGLYRYAIGVNFCYEIIILTHCLDTDILTAEANVYAVETWRDKTNSSVFERELLLEKHPVSECIQIAIRDFSDNCK